MVADYTCVSTYASNPVAINAVPALPTITSVTPTQPTCAVPTGSIVIASAGSNQYSINNGTTFTNTTGSFSGIAPSTSANIEVRLVADNTCVTTYANNPVIINPAPGAAANPVIAGGSSEPICGIIGAPTTVYTTSAAYSATYNWSVSAGGAVTNTSISNSGTATSSSNATVTWTNGFVGSTTISVSDGCTPVATRSITLSPYVTPAVSIDPTPNYIVCSTDQIHFTATPSGTGGATPTYQWKINGTNVGSNSATYTDNAPADGAVVTCVMTSNYACPTPGTNPATSNSTTVVVGVCNNTWNGSVAGDNTNWDNPGNWNANHVPANCADQANIPPGLTYYPVLTHAESVGDIILQQPGGNVNLGNYNLSVCGNITVETTTQAPASVTIPSTGGVIVLDGITGTSTQTVSGSVTAYEVKVNTQATGGIVLASGAGVSVFNALDLQQGNIDISQGSFTFESTGVSQAAILDNFSYGNNPGTITGSTVKSERYYAISGYTYTHQHMLGSPVNGEFLSQMGAGTTSGYVIPTGDCDEYWSGANTPYGNVFSLDQSHGASCGMAQWYVEPGTAPAVVGKGYSVVLAGTGVLSLTGSANVGSSYTLSPLANSNWVNTTYEHHTLSSGWQLVSNPYQATLALNTGNPGMDGQVQVWQANGPFVGTYQPGMVGSVNIAPFQAFMVHVTTPGNMTASYTINGADRVRTPATFYNQNANELDITAANLGNNLLDKTVVAFNPHATDSFDTQYDANKIPGSEGRHVLYTTLSDGKWIGINTLRDVATTSTVPVGFEPGSNGNYSFTFDKVNTFDPTTYIFLEDKQQQVMYNVRSGDYLFSSDTADNWNRFVLHFTPPAVISSMDAGCNSLGAINVSQPGTASWNYTLTDGSGTVISSGVPNQNSPLGINEPAGSYTLTLVDNNNYTVTKVIQLNGAQPVTAAFAPSANNVNTQTAVSFGNTSQNANTYSWNFGDGSTSGLVSPVHTYTAPGIYTVELTATNSSGCSSTTGQSITVNSVATGINNVVSENGISLWSNKNNVYVDFSNAGSDVNAVIKIYDVLGQEISEDKYTLNGLYQKEIDNIEAAYVIVAVNNNDKITTKKLFINNIAK